MYMASVTAVTASCLVQYHNAMQEFLMPVLIIAVSCLVIFGIMGILGVAAVHFERKQQVKEEHVQSSAPEETKAAKAV
jgi:hypothetical protein